MSTSPRTFPITADEAGRALQQFVRGQNRSRKVPQSPPMLHQFSLDNTVHIWNVGPWEAIAECGSAGRYVIPACKSGQEYAGPISIPGVVEEPIPVNETDFELRQEPGGGRYLAEQIVGVGMMLNPQNSLAKFGVFISEQLGFVDGKAKLPTKAEIVRAREALYAHLRSLVQEAREADQLGPEQRKMVIVPERHFVAARMLNLEDEPWMRAANPQGRKKCPFCAAMVDPSAVKCTNCKEVIDQKAYAELKKG